MCWNYHVQNAWLEKYVLLYLIEFDFQNRKVEGTVLHFFCPTHTHGPTSSGVSENYRKLLQVIKLSKTDNRFFSIYINHMDESIHFRFVSIEVQSVCVSKDIFALCTFYAYRSIYYLHKGGYAS